MTHRQDAPLASRKRPQQARSTDLVAAILQAAAQVLAAEGARRFTTARVAERAGVSIGSLYQYFPSKAAILFRLQSDEWRQTTQGLVEILTDDTMPAAERLRLYVRSFILSECEEAAVRSALEDTAPRYRQAPEARESREEGAGLLEAFLAELLPAAPDTARDTAAYLIETTMTQVGKRYSQTPRSAADAIRFADAMAAMFGAYLDTLREQRPR